MAWHNEIHNEKTYTGELQVGHSKGRVLGVGSSRDKVEELWSMLRYDVLLDESVDSNLRLRGASTKAQREHIKSDISAYIDQAENFYKFARSSDYRSAALLYYYSFLNLAKAYIIQNKPMLADKTFRHGINRKTKSGKLIDRSFQLQQSSGNSVCVFNEIYKLEYGSYLPSNKSISFEHTLGYITDISDETTKLLKKFSKKVHPSKLHVFINTNTNKCWNVLVTPPGFYPANYPATYNGFAAGFQRFNPGTLSLEFGFKMSQNEANQCSFSQSIEEYDILPSGAINLSDTRVQLDEVFGNNYQDYIYDNSMSLCITDPLRKNWQVPFNEPLSIYSMMFYLSEVVRYSPGEFNKNFAANTKEGWLIKNFIESSPYPCLVYLISKITGRTYIIKER